MFNKFTKWMNRLEDEATRKYEFPERVFKGEVTYEPTNIQILKFAAISTIVALVFVLLGILGIYILALIMGFYIFWLLPPLGLFAFIFGIYKVQP